MMRNKEAAQTTLHCLLDDTALMPGATETELASTSDIEGFELLSQAEYKELLKRIGFFIQESQQ